MGAATGMHQLYHSNIHQKGGAPVESVPLALKKHVPDPNCLLRNRRHKRYAAAQEWSAGLYWPGTFAHLPVLYKGAQGSPLPACSLQRWPLSPTKELQRLFTEAI